ncbi:inhibitor of nuclear factor kappa-B kinase subunit alpha-like isoform X1 [Dermacentor andersoni]|uniref:inhibitor of nuclear factor kappa-B kinase subunit alpha-like isoform X1 n=1 Tax=Dermacentor andersoni TaxID=34620 RepID=UPI0021559ECB|nr:inhibitor of nuclear factor kappa-B kinase subunit alpha-like isoform X1 [Dermacentor andersoni]XP_054918927.1 inhibitor of nuclear factor kappa-B kinase subunit alpha-like isoform X1 [Dermacentor andersoni]
MAKPTEEDKLVIGCWAEGKVLDRGTFGCITLWHNTKTQETIALKKCLRGVAEMTDKLQERWVQEVEILKKLDHPNVVKGLPVPEPLLVLASSLPFLAMEYCSGGNLRKMLQRPENSCGLHEKDVRCVLSDVTAGLQYLHSNHVIHRDLKPENIVLKNVEGKTVYKIIDLGYAKEFDQSSLCNSFVGTLQYLAPELFEKKPYTRAVDLWSLGILAYEVIVGQRPFSPTASPAQWIPLVHNKKSGDIRGDIAPNGERCYWKTLPVETCLTSVFKKDIEEWLQVLLETKPDQRSRHHGLTVFEILGKLLAQPTVHVFCIAKMSVVSVALKSEDSIMDCLSQALKNDTGVEAADQLLLTESGRVADIKYIKDNCKRFQEAGEVMLYLIDTSGHTDKDEESLWLQQLQECTTRLSDSRTYLKSIEIRREWALATYTVRQSVHTFQNVPRAFRSFQAHLSSEIPALQKALSSIHVDVNKLTAMMKVVHESYTTDVEYLQDWKKSKGGSSTDTGSLLKQWCVCDELLSDVYNQRKKVEYCFNKFNKLCTILEESQRTPYGQRTPLEILDDIMARMLQLYEKGKQKRDYDSVSNTCTNMCETIRELDQEQERVLKHVSPYMRSMLGVFHELGNLHHCVCKLSDRIVSISQALSTEQQQRQQSIWNLLRSETTRVQPVVPSVQDQIPPSAGDCASWNALCQQMDEQLKESRAQCIEAETVFELVDANIAKLEKECSELLKKMTTK